MALALHAAHAVAGAGRTGIRRGRSPVPRPSQSNRRCRAPPLNTAAHPGPQESVRTGAEVHQDVPELPVMAGGHLPSTLPLSSDGIGGFGQIPVTPSNGSSSSESPAITSSRLLSTAPATAAGHGLSLSTPTSSQLHYQQQQEQEQDEDSSTHASRINSGSQASSSSSASSSSRAGHRSNGRSTPVQQAARDGLLRDKMSFRRRGIRSSTRKRMPEVMSTVEELAAYTEGRLVQDQDQYLDAFITELLCPQANRWRSLQPGGASQPKAAAATSEQILGVFARSKLLSQDGEAIARAFADAARQGHVTACMELLEACVKLARREALERFSHKEFLRAAGAARATREVMRFLLLMPPALLDVRTYNMAIKACMVARDLRTAMMITHTMTERKVALDIKHATTLMSVCAAAKEHTEAFRLYKELRASGVPLDGRVYGALAACAARCIKSLSANRREQLVLLERVFDALGDALADAVFLEAPVWNALLMCAGRSGQLQRAFEVLDRMALAGVAPDSFTWTCLIQACVLVEEPDMAARVFERALAAGCTGSVQMYTAAINACTLYNPPDMRRALDVYAQLQRHDVEPDDLLYGNLIALAGRSRQLDVAFDLVQDMREGGLRPGMATCSALIYACISNGNLPAARKVYDTLQARSVVPHISQYNALMEQYALRFRLGTVVSLLGQMVEAGVKTNANTFRILVLAAQRADQAELAFELYQVAKARGYLRRDNERNVQSMMHGLLKLCFNRIREAWRPGGYPPAAHAAAPRSHINLRSQEAEQVLSLVDKSSRRQRTFLENADTINWSALALATYREFTTAGFKPTLEVLDKLLMCLRLPLASSAPSRIAGTGASGGAALSSSGGGSSGSSGGSGSGFTPLSPGAATAADAAVARSQELREMAREQESVGRLAGGYEMPYDKRALDIVGEAINAGLLPGLKVDQALDIDMRTFPPAVSEAWTHALLASLEARARGTQWATRRPVTHRVHLLVPPFDPNYIFWPSYVEKLELHYDEAQLRKYEQLQELQQQAAAAAAARQAASALAAADAAAAARAGASPAAQYGLDVEDEEISMGTWDVFDALRTQSPGHSMESTEEDQAAQLASVPEEPPAYEAGAITGLAVAATLRRMKAYAKVDAVSGTLRLEPRELNRWVAAKLDHAEQRERLERESNIASAQQAAAGAGAPVMGGPTAPFRPMGSAPGSFTPAGLGSPVAAGSLLQQQRRIRMGLGMQQQQPANPGAQFRPPPGALSGSSGGDAGAGGMRPSYLPSEHASVAWRPSSDAPSAAPQQQVQHQQQQQQPSAAQPPVADSKPQREATPAGAAAAAIAAAAIAKQLRVQSDAQQQAQQEQQQQQSGPKGHPISLRRPAKPAARAQPGHSSGSSGSSSGTSQQHVPNGSSSSNSSTATSGSAGSSSSSGNGRSKSGSKSGARSGRSSGRSSPKLGPSPSSSISSM